MSTALIQMGRAAGLNVWVTTRNEEGRKIAERLGANRVFQHGERLPRRVDVVIDNVGAATWAHSLASARRGGPVVVNGVTTGSTAETNILNIFIESLTVRGAIMGTREEMESLIRFVIEAGNYARRANACPRRKPAPKPRTLAGILARLPTQTGHQEGGGALMEFLLAGPQRRQGAGPL